VTEIERLVQSKTSSASTTALIVGFIGTALMAGATFAFIFAEMIPLMIALAVPGFICWFIPYQIYKKIRAKRNAKVTPLIEQQYDAIYEVCEKAHGLLA
jgi:predicted Co/Zn/Cd cation transporter (cation efflux family)